MVTHTFLTLLRSGSLFYKLVSKSVLPSLTCLPLSAEDEVSEAARLPLRLVTTLPLLTSRDEEKGKRFRRVTFFFRMRTLSYCEEYVVRLLAQLTNSAFTTCFSDFLAARSSSRSS